MAANERTQRFPSKGCFDLKLTGFEEDTMTKFIVWTKDKAFGVDDPKPGSKKVMWELQYVPFDGIPFMVVGRRVYSSHQGVDKHKHEKQTRQLQLLDDCSDHQYKGSRRLQDSKKLGCPARIYVVHLIRFPDYKIPDDIHKQRKESSGSLRRALTTNPSAVKFEEQYVGHFPEIEEHKNHHVVKEPFKGEAAPPPTRRRFYALDKDIRNIIKSTKGSRALTKSICREFGNVQQSTDDNGFSGDSARLKSPKSFCVTFTEKNPG
ncbi:uncharacterized protein [Misgurnus anguillicaudatus]|uniref:uncharacterized protein isoform X1 n=1 Tax=Misgurnus anguillicaudatus TaxID=75329 RepID=UPI003CCF23E0